MSAMSLPRAVRAAVLWACGLLVALAVALPAAAQDVTAVREALFWWGDDAGTPRQVVLPDTWAQRGIGSTGLGTYRVRFHLGDAPQAPMAVSLSRVSSSRRVLLNGHLIEDTRRHGYSHPVRAVIPLPPLMLRVGENELVIEVQHRIQGGLSELRLGPTAELSSRVAFDELQLDELPRSLNMAAALLAVMLLLAWWRRPAERSMGLFGCLALLGSVRNYSYFMEVALLPVAVGDFVYFAAQLWSVLLFTVFALSLHPRPPGRLDRGLLLAGVAVTVLSAVGAAFGGLPLMRKVVYPFLLLGGIATLGIVWSAARRDRSRMNIALTVGFAVLMAAAAHDYAFQQGHLPVTGRFWVPFAMPLAFGVYGLMQLHRFVHALNEAEGMNRELERRVEQRTRRLQEAVATKSRFIASASHDLRQPVAAIGLMVGLLREQITAPRLRTMVDRVDEAVASMETMLKGLLDLSRLDSGTVRPTVQRVVLQSLFDAIQVHEGDAAVRKGLRVRFRPTGLAVQTDPVLLEQVLRNLVSNAVRYTERGGVLVTARRRGTDRVLLQVWDSGVGIAPEHQAGVFEEFVQVGNAAREGRRGFGLGLSIVRRSVDLLGHELSLHSKPGRGTCFSLVLPRGPDERRARPRLPAHHQPLAGVRMVLVEDDEAVRESLAERLRTWGAQVQAYDGVPALRAALPPVGQARDGRFTDLLLTDHRLPGGSGLLVIELVRQRCGATRAMVVTGDTSPGDLSLLAQSGLPVLHKPFRAEELLEAIERALATTAIGELPA